MISFLASGCLGLIVAVILWVVIIGAAVLYMGGYRL